jgi:hypothetical protein
MPSGLFRRLVSLRNDVGLLSEEYDPSGSRQLGNFPQAFSHVALINTAFNLTRAEKPAEQRSDLPRGPRRKPRPRHPRDPALQVWCAIRSCPPGKASPTLRPRPRRSSGPRYQGRR